MRRAISVECSERFTIRLNSEINNVHIARTKICCVNTAENYLDEGRNFQRINIKV